LTSSRNISELCKHKFDSRSNWSVGCSSRFDAPRTNILCREGFAETILLRRSAVTLGPGKLKETVLLGELASNIRELICGEILKQAEIDILFMLDGFGQKDIGRRRCHQKCG
jgi:hypothetical protein